MTAIPLREHAGRHRIAARLAGKLDKTLVAYTNAATAASVGILALTCPAEAKIVFTHVDKQLPLNKTFFLDLNHDGISDFGFNNTRATTSLGGGWGVLTIFPTKSANKIWGDKTNNGFIRYASALSAGTKVGPKGKFTPGNKLMAHSSSDAGRPRQSSRSCEGPWGNVTDRYLGLKFIIKGKTHYGWARLNVSCSNLTVTATLTGYAYETLPNKPIIAGKTKGPDDGSADQPDAAAFVAPSPERTTLGLLALGAPGLSIWRRKVSTVQ